MDSYLKNYNMLNVMLKWKIHLLVIIAFSMLIIGFSTYLIKPKYKSSAVVYPVNLGQFSEESYTEQMIQILNSRDVTDSVIKKYELIKHYGVNENSKKVLTEVYDTYNSNVSVSKTKYESVEICVLDIDPKIAKDMVNSIIHYYNLKVQSLHRVKTKEVMELSKSEMIKWKLVLDSLYNKLQFYKTEYNIQNVDIQLEGITQGMYRASGNKKLIEKAEKQIELLGKYGTEFTFYKLEYENAYELYKSNKLAYLNAVKEYNKEITYAGIVTSPYVSNDKYSPDRIVIALFGGLSTLILLLIIISFIEREK